MKMDHRLRITNVVPLKVLALIIVILVITCKEPDQFRKIREGDFSLVTKGKFSGRLTYLGPDSDYTDVIENLVKSIDKNSDVLSLMTQHYFTVAESLSYKFMYASVDQENKVLVLRYFARIQSSPLYAGYQIQFAFDEKSKALARIFIIEVPLE